MEGCKIRPQIGVTQHMNLTFREYCRRIFTLLALLLFAFAPGIGWSGTLTRINPELTAVDGDTQALHQQMLAQNAERNYASAIDAAQSIVGQIESRQGNPAEAYLNLGLLQAAAGDLATAIETVGRSIEAGEAHGGGVDPGLIRALEVKGLLLRLTGKLDDATLALRRAQHLVHRSFGVNSTEQQDILDQLTLVQLQARDVEGAIAQQEFSYRTFVDQLGVDNIELLPHVRRYALFMACLGQFRPALEALDDAIKRIERAHPGMDHDYLISPLQSIAQIRLLERELSIFNGAVPDLGPETEWLSAILGDRYYLQPPEKAHSGETVELRIHPPLNPRTKDEPPPVANIPRLPASQREPLDDQVVQLSRDTPYSVSVGITDSESRRPNRVMPYMRSAIMAQRRIVSILDADADADLVDKVAAMVVLGDTYAISGSGQAFDVYQKAWWLIQESSSPEMLEERFFGAASLIQPRKLVPLPVPNRRQSETLQVHVQFDVTSDGKVMNIRVLESNVPTSEIRDFKRQLGSFQYRPRMEGGRFIETKDINLTRTFYGKL